jgi:hypothetical protein
MIAKLLNVALAAALGFAVCTPLYAADTSQTPQASRTDTMSDADYRAAMDKCNKLTDTARGKCIVNIRPTPAGSNAANPQGSSTEANTVKDGTAVTEAEYAAAVKECESVVAADRERCVSTAKEHFGRM